MKIFIFTQIILATIDKTDWLTDIWLRYIENQSFAGLEFRFQFGESMLPLKTRQIIPVLIIKLLPLRLRGKCGRLELFSASCVREVCHSMQEALNVKRFKWKCDFHG